jgi:hypothetical protein
MLLARAPIDAMVNSAGIAGYGHPPANVLMQIFA